MSDEIRHATTSQHSWLRYFTAAPLTTMSDGRVSPSSLPCSSAGKARQLSDTGNYGEQSWLLRTAAALNIARQALGDAALGIGQVVSTAISSSLPQKIIPRIWTIGAGSARALGGGMTALTAGYRIIDTFREETAAGLENYPKTRRELFKTGASVTAGLGAGTLGGVAVSGALLLGAPAAAVAGIGMLGAAGAGYAAYKAYDWAERVYNDLIS